VNRPAADAPLVESPDYAFAFRELGATRPRRLLVALHGADGDESQFAAFAAERGAQDIVVLPRAPRTIGGGRLGWFRETVGDGDARAEPQEFDESLDRLLAFVGQQQRRHDVSPDDTVLLGFSQGAALALSAAATTPHCCAAVAAIAGRLPRRVEDRVADPQSLAGLRVLLVHAADDPVLPKAHAEEAAGFLAAQGVAPTLRVTGHEHRFTPAAARELHRWLDAPASSH
jgi:phospholipase/carboxylesterase